MPLVFKHDCDVVAAFWAVMYAGAIPAILPFIAPEARSNAMLEQVKHLARLGRDMLRCACRSVTVFAPARYESYLRDRLADAARRIVCLPKLMTESPKGFLRKASG